MNTSISLNVQAQQEIRILTITKISPGIDVEKDSAEAFFDCVVQWCPIDIDTHIATLAQDELTKTESVRILGYSPQWITPGIYKKVVLQNRIAFEQM